MFEVFPDFSILFPETGLKISDFKEKVEAACRTAELLGFDEEPTAEDFEAVEPIIYEAVDPHADHQKHVIKATESFKPATYYAARGVLNEYAVRVVENATQIRLMVTNKLILEAENPDPRIRMKALELLGKITDVGLFTEKSEVTVTHRSTEDLVVSIRDKIAAMREPKELNPSSSAVIEGQVVEVADILGE